LTARLRGQGVSSEATVLCVRDPLVKNASTGLRAAQLAAVEVAAVHSVAVGVDEFVAGNQEVSIVRAPMADGLNEERLGLANFSAPRLGRLVQRSPERIHVHNLPTPAMRGEGGPNVAKLVRIVADDGVGEVA